MYNSRVSHSCHFLLLRCYLCFPIPGQIIFVFNVVTRIVVFVFSFNQKEHIIAQWALCDRRLRKIENKQLQVEGTLKIKL